MGLGAVPGQGGFCGGHEGPEGFKHRPGLGLEAALAEARSGAGTRYDGDVVAACERVFAQGFVFPEA